eukprot:6198186-Pleurochrysis_carterae.AAC.5
MAPTCRSIALCDSPCHLFRLLFCRFLDRRSVDPKPFLAALWLHTPHAPTPALPRFYHACTHAEHTRRQAEPNVGQFILACIKYSA